MVIGKEIYLFGYSGKLNTLAREDDGGAGEGAELIGT